MSRSLLESQLSREVARLGQELVSLKAPQRYLVGRAKGYESNKVRVISRILDNQGGYQLRGILGVLKFEGDKVDKTVIPMLKFQLYNSNGYPISPSLTPDNGKVVIYMMESVSGDTPNVTEFSVDMLMSNQGTADAFYADFWCVGNDSGIISYLRDLKRNGNE